MAARVDRKDRVRQLTEDLLRSTSYEVVALRELVDLMIEETKDKLIETIGDETLRVQGEARALVRFHRSLTRPAPPTTQQEQQL